MSQKKEGIKLRTSLLKDRSESCEGALELFGNYSRTNTQRLGIHAYINTKLNYSKNKLAIQNSKASSNSSIGNVEIKVALKLQAILPPLVTSSVLTASIL